MADRVFIAEEVNAALGFQWTEIEVTEAESQAWWSTTYLDSPFHIAALALGVLPEGWELAEVWEGDEVVKRYYHFGPSAEPEIEAHPGGRLWVRDWPEAVRTGHAETACRLLAAHVELERRRSEPNADSSR